jgi:hypothetical protein
LKKNLKNQKKELLTLKKIIKNYTMKIKTEKKLTGSWITFYDSVLYAHGIINEDFYGTFRGGIARKFCEIFESDLRPWKTINEETVKKCDKVSLTGSFLLTQLRFLVKCPQDVLFLFLYFSKIA